MLEAGVRVGVCHHRLTTIKDPTGYHDGGARAPEVFGFCLHAFPSRDLSTRTPALSPPVCSGQQKYIPPPFYLLPL